MNSSFPKEKYKYYQKDFIFPSTSLLKTDGIYFKISDEIFEYDVETYDKYYSEKGHPALKGLKPKNDTIINFNRFFYLHFTKEGTWSRSGGYYSQQEMINDFKVKNAQNSYDLYKITNDTLYLESYNAYRKKLEYLKALIKEDAIYVSGLNNDTSSTQYNFFKI